MDNNGGESVINSSVTNSDKFIAIYNEIDRFMRKALKADDKVSHSSLVYEIAKVNRVFSYYKEDLLSYARLRNAIVHNPDKKDADPIAEPHDFIINKYDGIKGKVLNPAKAIDTIAIKAGEIFTTNLEASTIDVMKIMNDNIYTHVPVIENGILIGVFSENTIFSYMATNGDIILEKDVRISEFKDFIPIAKHQSEFFEFISRDSTIIDVEGLFQKDLQDKKRLAVVFITQNGAPNEKILGMITAWDIAGYRR